MNQIGIARLAVEGPGVRDVSVDLVSDQVSLGRADDNLVVLPDASISRHHARVVVEADTYLVMDLGSLNGTVVNGIRLGARQPFMLRDGDRIQIGPFALTFVVAHQPPTTDQPQLRLGTETNGQVTTSATRFDMPAVPEMLPPASDRPVLMPDVAPPRLVIWTGRHSNEYLLVGDIMSIGRDDDNAIVVDDPTVSRRHCEIRRTLAGFEIVDLGSGNGLFHQGQRISHKLLSDNDSFQIGDSVHVIFRANERLPIRHESNASQRLEIGPSGRISIGRDISNDVTLDHPQVSRHHARLEVRPDGYVLFDLDSTNGTFVNGERINQQALRETDHFQIGPYDFTVSGGQVRALSSEGNIQVDAIALTKRVSKGKTILDNVYLTIRPREFIAVVGASGAGKSTLLDALSGFRPASTGRVLYNGNDLYRTFDAFRTSIGYVPQDDIIHKDLPVRRAMKYAAMLRLPRDTTDDERDNRIDEVLSDLALTEQADTPIHRLSGGQRKRVSMGVELLTRPSLFFLDEPTSGLDPATETRLMRLMRELADQGRTLILVTHATQNILLCDKVVFMGRGGRVVFFGSPQEALDYFQVQEFVDIYDLMEREPVQGAYADRYKSSPYHDRYLGEIAGTGTPSMVATQSDRPPDPARSGISSFRQLYILTLRYADILLSNKRALLILLLQAPIVAILIGLVFPRAIFDERPIVVPNEQVVAAGLQPSLIAPYKSCGLSNDEINDIPPPLRDDNMTRPCGDARKAMLMLFLVSVVSIWFGASNAAKEIVKELPIYRRERMVSLKIVPYLLSKMAVLFVISFFQTILLLAIVMGMIAFPFSFGTLFGVLLTTYVTFVTATMMGLFISSLVGTNDEAGNLVPILLIPQIIFAGAMLSLTEMGNASRVLAQFVVSKWSWEVLGAVLNIPYYAEKQGGSMLSLLDPGKWKYTFDIVIWGHYLVLGLFCLFFLLGSSLALKRKDSL